MNVCIVYTLICHIYVKMLNYPNAPEPGLQTVLSMGHWPDGMQI